MHNVSISFVLKALYSSTRHSMNHLKRCVIALILPLLIHSLEGITLPVSEDSYSMVTKVGAQPKLTAITGSRAMLLVSKKCTGFVRFEAGSLATDFPAAEVSRALLMVYFTKVGQAGALNLHAVAADWTESPPSTIAAPGVSATPIATIPSDAVIPAQFAIIDITEQVRTWLTTPASDFGIAISSDGTANVEIGAKEGPGTGYPAVLQIERNPMIGNSQISSGIDAAKLGDGSVDNVELSYLNGVSSVIQPQLDELETGLGEVHGEVEGKVSKAGDTMTGTLRVPVNGLRVGEAQLIASNDKVGIGTNAPTAALDVRGDVRLGAAGELQALGSDSGQTLRIVRGTFLFDGTLHITGGQGFTTATTGDQNKDVRITFTKPFSAPPTIVFMNEDLAAFPSDLRNVTASGATVRSAAYSSGVKTHFIAIGIP
jgi:hypothetical protein